MSAIDRHDAATNGKKTRGARVAGLWERASITFDSWVNTVTGLGIRGRDKVMSAFFDRTLLLTDEELDDLYESDDTAAKIVDKPIDEALRKGWRVKVTLDAQPEREKADKPGDVVDEPRGDANEEAARAVEIGDEIHDWLENTFKMTELVEEAWAWGRLFGAGALFVIVDDGRETEEPLDLERARTIEGIVVLEKRDLSPWSAYDDPTNPKHGQTELYRLNPLVSASGAATSNSITFGDTLIHESRLVFFHGVRTTTRKRAQREGWRNSVLQRVNDVLRHYQISWQALTNLLQDASQAVFKIDGLIEMIASKEKEALQARMALVDLNRSVSRAVLLDAEQEEFTRDAPSLSGYPETIALFLYRVAAAADMPITVLFGMSPAGMNATGESDRLLWAQRVESEQDRKLRPALSRVVEIAMACSEGPTGGTVFKFAIEFEPLILMTDEQKSTIRKNQAEIDERYITLGVYTADECSVSRFGGTEYSVETSIDVGDRQRAIEAMRRPPEADPDVDDEEDDDTDPTVVPPAPMPGAPPTPGTPAPAPAPEPPRPEEAKDPASAFNGAQVTALQGIVVAVVEGTLPKSTAAKMIAMAFPVTPEQAEDLLVDVEEGSQPPAPPPAFPGAPPPPAPGEDPPEDPPTDPEPEPEPEPPAPDDEE